jgi:hypothetical protein
MKSFDITKLAAGATAVVDWRPRRTHRGWDSIAAAVVGRMSVDGLRAKFVPGKRIAVGAGFILMDVDPEPLPGGWSRAALEFQGIFAAKKFGQAVPSHVAREMANGVVRTTGTPNYNTPGTTEYTTFTKLATHESQPAYVVEAWDTLAPVYSNIGKGQLTLPYTGLAFPTMSQSSNPWQFANPVTDATRNEPHGWVQTGLEVEEIGTTVKLYRKLLTFLWVWKYTP